MNQELARELPVCPTPSDAGFALTAVERIAEKVGPVLAMADNLPSPCISVCRMDAQSGLCEGCLRTLDEIARWSTLPDAGKREVWALIGRRVAAMQEPRS